MKRKRESFSPLITFWSCAKPEDLVNHFLWCIFMIEVLCVLQVWLTQFPLRKHEIIHYISFVCDSWELRDRKANWLRVWPSSLSGESPEQAPCTKLQSAASLEAPPVHCSSVSPAAAASPWISSVSMAHGATGRWIFFPYLINQANCCRLQCSTCCMCGWQGPDYNSLLCDVFLNIRHVSELYYILEISSKHDGDGNVWNLSAHLQLLRPNLHSQARLLHSLQIIFFNQTLLGTFS